MGIITIRCPKTGRAISTGIETDDDSFARCPDVLARTRCPICELDHVWWTREAWLADYTKQVSLPFPDQPQLDEVLSRSGKSTG